MIEQVLAGDELAFNTLCLLETKHVLFSCMKIMGNKQDGEDAAQEVFLKIKKNIFTLKNAAAYDVWLRKVIVNTCIDLKKKTKKEKAHVSYDDYEEFLVDENAELLPISALEQKEKTEYLKYVISSFSPKYRTVLLLYYYEGLDRKDIAAVLETTVSSVDHILARARAKMKQELERKFGEKTLGKSYSVAPDLAIVSALLRSEADELITEEVITEFDSKRSDSFLNSDNINNSKKKSFGKSSTKAGGTMKLGVTAAAIVSTAAIVVTASLLLGNSPISAQYNEPPVVTAPASVAENGFDNEKDIETSNLVGSETNDEGVAIGDEGSAVTLVGNVFLLKKNENIQSDLSEEGTAGVEIYLLNSAGKKLEKISTDEDGSYSLENVEIDKSQQYKLKVSVPKSLGYKVVNPNNNGIIEIELTDEKRQILPTIYLEDTSSIALEISLENSAGEVSNVNPNKAAILLFSTSEVDFIWEIHEKDTGILLKSGVGKELDESVFALTPKNGMQEYILKVKAVTASGKTIEKEKNFFITK